MPMSRSVKKTYAGHNRHYSKKPKKIMTHQIERSFQHNAINVQSRIEPYPALTDNTMFMYHGDYHYYQDTTGLDIDIPARFRPGHVTSKHGPRMFKVKPNYIKWDLDRYMPLGRVIVNPHTREYHQDMGK